MSKKGKSLETKSRSVVTWGWEWEQGLTAKRHKETFYGDGNILKLDCDGYKTPEIYF